MRQQPADIISANPRSVPSWVAWVTAVAVLAAALAGAITIAIHYRAEAAALRRQVHSVPAPPPRRTVPIRLSTGTAELPPHRSLHGEITVFSARSAGQWAQIMLSVRIVGGMPHTSYDLLGFDCDGSSVGYQTWADGITDADGSGILSGKALPVSLSDEYWLYLSLPSRPAGPGLLGSFTRAGQFSAVPARSC